MKKLLLTFLVAAGALTVAAQSPYTAKWTASLAQGLKEDAKSFNSPVATNENGDVVAALPYDQELTIAGQTFDAIGTGAYIVKYDATGVGALWAVNLEGAATVSDIKMDAEGNIYAAGTFADEVTFGTTSGDAIVKGGAQIEGDYTTQKLASFIAKWDKDGKVLAVKALVPESQPELEETGMFYPTVDDIACRITDMEISKDGKVYASISYKNMVKVDDVTFKSWYNDPWFGVFFIPLEAEAIFSLDSDLSNCTSIFTFGNSEALATEDTASEAYGCTFTLYDGVVYASFVGNGALSLNGTALDKAADADYAVFVSSAAAAQPTIIDYTKSGMKAMEINAMTCDGTKLYAAGAMPFTTGEGDAAVTKDTNCLLTASISDLSDNSGFTNPFTNLETENGYYKIKELVYADAATPSIFAATRITYTERVTVDEKDYANGDEGESTALYTLANNAMTASTFAADACNVAAANGYVATASPIAGGALVGLYAAEKSGVEDIMITPENGPVKAYNLQGIEVEPTAKGLIIVNGKKVYNK